jgi:hypothetical protein
MLAVAAEAAGLFGTLQKKPGAHAKIDWDVRVQELDVIYVIKMSMRQEYGVKFRLHVSQISGC